MKNALSLLLALVFASCCLQTKKNKMMTEIPNNFVVTDPPEIEMVFVEGGTFWMGDDRYVDHSPRHQVTLSDFYIGKYEVTQREWEAVMGTTVVTQAKKVREQEIAERPYIEFVNGPKTWGEGDNYPMYYVSWDEAQEFISKLNAATGKQYALPTEAQWEYAAKGGNKSRNYIYSGSDTINNVAWFSGNSPNRSSPVGTKSANELGIHDMTGNVFEWCSDWYDTYPDSLQVDPVGPPKGRDRGSWGEAHVFRGSNWYNNASASQTFLRGYENPDLRDSGGGFRLVLLPQK